MVTVHQSRHGVRTAHINSFTGINCMNLPSAMWWDKRTSEEGPEALAVAEARSKAAGCQINNRCSKPPYEKVWECDEFPFKTTDPARMMQPAGAVPINRCVPRIQNKCKSNHCLPQSPALVY